MTTAAGRRRRLGGHSRLGAAACIAVALILESGLTLGAQQPRPLSPVPPDGQRVVPFFDGYYENPDGSITFSFGFSNLNRKEVVEIPLGPNNFIEPRQFDGKQPTSFPPVTAGDGPAARRDRERGVFTVTVPPGFKGDVVWTLTHLGHTHKVPARAKTSAYRLAWPMAMGSIPPLLRFKADGPTGRGPVGIQSEALKAAVNTPLELTIWLHDDSKRTEEVPIKERGPVRPAINVVWNKHSGPGPVTFDPPKSPLADLKGTASTKVTFTQPGTYMLRVRADNFGRVDTSAGNQCCWTNGYIPVVVQ